MLTNKTAKALALGTLTALSSVTAQADDQQLLDTLLKNGTITPAQHSELTGQQVAEKQAEAKKVAEPKGSDVLVKFGKKGFRVETADEKFKFKIGGRMHVDATFNANDKDFDQRGTEGVEVRRARLAVSGVLWHDYKYKAQFDFADNDLAIKDLFVKYTGFDWFNITVGNQKQAISLELQNSSNDMPFTERSLVSSLTVPMFDRAIGLRIDSSGKNWSTQLGFYGDNIGKNGIQVNDEGWGVSSRVTFAPIMTKKHILHVGASAGYRATSDEGTTLKYKYETTHMSNLYFTNAKVTDVDGVTLADVEAAYMFGSFSVQAEYAHTWIEREGMGGVDFGAYYVQAAWTLTGESRNYKGSYGKFKRLKPANEFSWSKGTWGAVELATRFDGNDLNSGDIQGGEEHAVTVALNWYLNQNVRLMADYRYAFDVTNSAVKDVNGSEIDGGTHDFTFRTQLTF